MKQRNPIAKANSLVNRPKVIKSKKIYSRKGKKYDQ